MNGPGSIMTEVQRRFAERAVRRKRLFLVLSLTGVVLALLLAIFYAYRYWSDPTYPLGPRAVIVLLVLLNARQNLRQYRFAGVLEQSLESGRTDRLR
jgi:hypothetical protein